MHHALDAVLYYTIPLKTIAYFRQSTNAKAFQRVAHLTASSAAWAEKRKKARAREKRRTKQKRKISLNECNENPLHLYLYLCVRVCALLYEMTSGVIFRQKNAASNITVVGGNGDNGGFF